MNPMTLIIIAITIFICIGITLFLVFTRQGKNIATEITKRKKYVVCHLKHTATGFVDVYKVVPDKSYYTKVGECEYNLNPQYSFMEWRGRLHFVLNERDSIPVYPARTESKKEIIQQTNEITTALNTSAYDDLYKKSKDIAMILAGIGLIISILANIYIIYTLSKYGDMLAFLMNKP